MGDVLVTGASGFIGHHLTRRLLQRGDRVRALVRVVSRGERLKDDGAVLVQGDVADLDSLRRAVSGASVVYHLAGITKAFTARQYYAVNRRGVSRVARVCAEQQSPPVLIVVSSLAAAGPAKDRPREESDEPRPVSIYGRSKRAGERVAERYAAQVPTTIVRPPMVFGERDVGFFEMFKAIAVSGVHPVPGFAPRTYSVIHADDLVEALMLAADRGERLPADARTAELQGTGYYFAACDEQPTYYQLGRLIGTALGRRRTLTIPFGPVVVRAVGAFGELSGRLRGQPAVMNCDKAREALAGSWTCSAEKAKQGLGFHLPCSLSERLRQTVQWYRDEGWL
ncbi:MAG: SDR family NAD(P)-dependent oxidoreductase [Planctomycetaceae bacterium]|nr:SDR family NAD(P)-dependent oxidoreductase [Planctomycetaceae bacterium]